MRTTQKNLRVDINAIVSILHIIPCYRSPFKQLSYRRYLVVEYYSFFEPLLQSSLLLLPCPVNQQTAQCVALVFWQHICQVLLSAQVWMMWRAVSLYFQHNLSKMVQIKCHHESVIQSKSVKKANNSGFMGWAAIRNSDCFFLSHATYNVINLYSPQNDRKIKQNNIIWKKVNSLALVI